MNQKKKKLKRLFLILASMILLIFTGLYFSRSLAFFGWFSKKIENFILEVPLRESPQEIRFAFVSDMNIYPIPTDHERFPQPPMSTVGILYKESQVLFQEFVRDIVDNQKDLSLDFVLFGGSQVANNLHWQLFQDIADEIYKNDIDYFYLLGDGEYRGPSPISELTKERYWHKKNKGVNFIGIDNAWDKISAEQAEWLGMRVAELLKNREEVYFFSYRPLDSQTRLMIERLPGLKLLANSYNLKTTIFDAGKGTENPVESPYVFKKYTYVSNPALSVYPCYFTLFIRKANGELVIKLIETKLKGVARKGEKILKDSGLDPDAYIYEEKINPDGDLKTSF